MYLGISSKASRIRPKSALENPRAAHRRPPLAYPSCRRGELSSWAIACEREGFIRRKTLLASHPRRREKTHFRSNLASLFPAVVEALCQILVEPIARAVLLTGPHHRFPGLRRDREFLLLTKFCGLFCCCIDPVIPPPPVAASNLGTCTSSHR